MTDIERIAHVCHEANRALQVTGHREHTGGELRWCNPLEKITELRGKDLMCWCPLEDEDGNPIPCHAEVLLEIANPKENQ